ncbi:MAG: hypothetical protein J5J06_04075 [Phycisphaerae bacterium]|nr:hypothetical protein [Phycisphaerae bacterium]
MRMFDEQGFTGWSTYEVKVFGKTDEITGYKGLSVLGRCGPTDDSKARLVWVEPNPEHMGMPGLPVTAVQQKFGLYFDPDTWDGCDFFLPEGSAWIFVTERVAKALKKARATNVSLTPLPEQRLP